MPDEPAPSTSAIVEVVAEKVGGVTSNRRRKIPADQKLDGAPSVLYDAVAIIASKEGAEKLSGMHVAKTFLADAHAHMKFIALSAAAQEEFWNAAVYAEPDEGVHMIEGADDAGSFLSACGKLRFWERDA